MDTNFKKLVQRIISASNSKAIEKVNVLMDRISGNVIVAGTGGSFVVAEFINSVLNKANNCFSNSMYPRDVFFQNLGLVDYVILVTYSGKTHEICECIKYCKKYKNIKEIVVVTRDDKMLLNRIEKDSNVNIIKYGDGDTKEKSFISIASTFMPISIFAKSIFKKSKLNFELYVSELFENVENIINETTKNIDWTMLKSKPFLEVIYETESKSSAQMLESNLIESGIAHVVLHEKKHLSHGRYVLGSLNKAPITIFLKNSNNILYDNRIFEYYSEDINNNFFLLINNSKHGIEGEFEMLVKTLFLTKNISEKLDVDLSRINYPILAQKLYKYRNKLV